MKGPQEDILVNGKHRISAGALLDFFDLTTVGMLNSLPFSAMLIDQHRRILLANRALLDRSGLELEEILGENCARVVHGTDELTCDACPLARAVETQGPVENEHYNKNLGRWFKIAIYPTETRAPHGEAIFFHLIIDITELMRVQKSLIRSEEKYRMLLEELLKTPAHSKLLTKGVKPDS